MNLSKCVVYPIRCENIDVHDILAPFGGRQGAFPCIYLGLPLCLKAPQKIEWQPLLDKFGVRLKPWKGKLMSRKGRLELVNTVLTALTTYLFTIFPPPKWLLRKIDRFRRSFLWSGEEDAPRSKCLVNWNKVCSPKDYGGLGIKDLDRYSRALRLRWLWFEWDEEPRPWKGLPVPCDTTDRNLFAACTKLELGNGESISFWCDIWLLDCPLKLFTPDLFKLAYKKKICVKEGLQTNRWMRGLHRITTELQID